MDMRAHDTPVATLADLLPGQHATITGLSGESELRTRLQSLGLRPGRRVTVVRRSRFGGPIQIRLGTSDLLIRPQQARTIFIK